MAACKPGLQTRSANQVAPGTWGSFGSRLSPSFWCEQAPRQLASVAHLPHYCAPGQPTVEEYIVRHSDAERFREEHPACQGARLRSKGASKLKVPGLVQVAAPTTAVFQSAWRRGSPRRPNESVTLTPKGQALLKCAPGGRGSLGPDTLAYELKYVCAGVTTYKVKGVVAVHQAPARTAATINTDAFVTFTRWQSPSS